MELREITDSEPKNKSAFLNVQEANSTEVSQVNKALWQTKEHNIGSVRDDQGYKMELTFNRKDAIGLKIKISNKILKYDE